MGNMCGDGVYLCTHKYTHTMIINIYIHTRMEIIVWESGLNLETIGRQRKESWEWSSLQNHPKGQYSQQRGDW